MITRRNFLAGMAAGGVAASVWPDNWASAAPKRKPNVIILFIDDLGYGDVGAFGCKDIPTPNMDQLAKQGVKCTNSYITNPPCSPSRCSLLTGMYAQRFGKFGMARGLPIPMDKTMAHFMRGAGYVTGMIGKWDVGSPKQSPMACGFMEVAKRAPAKAKKRFICTKKDGSEGYRTEVDGDNMVEFVERNKDKPFFLYFSPLAVHSPSSEAPERLRKRSTAKKKRKALAGAIISVDDQIGKLLAVLKKHKLEKDTLIFLTGDNGPNLGEGGSANPYRGGKGNGTQQEGWVHTPAIISYPGVLPLGTTYEGLTCTLDYYATMAAVAGKPQPKHCDGVDILPFLQGKKRGDAHEMLFWKNCDPTDPPHRNLTAVRWKNWRLIKDKKTKKWKLFDLKSDPKEKKDLAAGNANVVAAMSKRHAEWAKTLPAVKTAKASGRPEKSGGNIPVGHGWVFTK